MVGVKGIVFFVFAPQEPRLKCINLDVAHCHHIFIIIPLSQFLLTFLSSLPFHSQPPLNINSKQHEVYLWLCSYEDMYHCKILRYMRFNGHF